jgi:hypothetical protein
MLILSIRTAVDSEQQRNLGALDVARRIGQQAADDGAVLALEIDFFGRRKIELVEQSIVLMRQSAEFAVFKHVNFVRRVVAA